MVWFYVFFIFCCIFEESINICIACTVFTVLQKHIKDCILYEFTVEIKMITAQTAVLFFFVLPHFTWWQVTCTRGTLRALKLSWFRNTLHKNVYYNFTSVIIESSLGLINSMFYSLLNHLPKRGPIYLTSPFFSLFSLSEHLFQMQRHFLYCRHSQDIRIIYNGMDLLVGQFNMFW